jgi:hypothetical protein
MEVLTWDRISMISFSAAAIPRRATGKEIKTKKPFRGRGRAFEHFGAHNERDFRIACAAETYRPAAALFCLNFPVLLFVFK